MSTPPTQNFDPKQWSVPLVFAVGATIAIAQAYAQFARLEDKVESLVEAQSDDALDDLEDRVDEVDRRLLRLEVTYDATKPPVRSTAWSSHLGDRAEEEDSSEEAAESPRDTLPRPPRP